MKRDQFYRPKKLKLLSVNDMKMLYKQTRKSSNDRLVAFLPYYTRMELQLNSKFIIVQIHGY